MLQFRGNWRDAMRLALNVKSAELSSFSKLLWKPCLESTSAVKRQSKNVSKRASISLKA